MMKLRKDIPFFLAVGWLLFLSFSTPECDGAATRNFGSHHTPAFAATLTRPSSSSESATKTSTMTKKMIEAKVAKKFAGLDLTWEQEVADKIRDQLYLKQMEDPSSTEPLMVSVVGAPGSGKSTSVEVLEHLLQDVGCLNMPFDGYHITMDQLKSMPNAADVIYRRGAPDTFDANGLKYDLLRIKCGDEDVIHVPGFDHAAGDPEPDAYQFERGQHNVVLCEGLYLLHDEDGWEEFAAAKLFDYKIFVDADVDTCVERLKIRNKCIPGYTPEEILLRCEAVERVNAMTVNQSKKNADLIVQSAAAKKSSSEELRP